MLTKVSKDNNMVKMVIKAKIIDHNNDHLIIVIIKIVWV